MLNLGLGRQVRGNPNIVWICKSLELELCGQAVKQPRYNPNYLKMYDMSLLHMKEKNYEDSYCCTSFNHGTRIPISHANKSHDLFVGIFQLKMF